MITARVAIRALIVVALITLVAVLLGLRSCDAARTASTEAKLNKGQAGAAIASGQDATGTIGTRMDADAAADQIGRENEHAIRNAEGADAPVAPAARDAGLAGLCRRAAYRSDPRCVQHPDP